jgi:hypothetical protein
MWGIGARLSALPIALVVGVGACGAAPRRAAPAVAATQQQPAGVPLDACGVYLEDAAHGTAALANIGGRPVLLWDGLTVIQVKPAASGFTLVLPPVEEGGDERPASLELRPPSAGDDRWTLGPWRQWRDPRATSLLQAGGTRRLVRVDDHQIQAIGNIRRTTRLVRERPARDLQELAGSIDPDVLRSRGGVIGVVLQELSSLLDDLAEAVTPAEQARFAGYRRAVEQVSAGNGSLWPPGDDEFLLRLAARRWASRDEVVLRDGALMYSLPGDKDSRSECMIGLMIPDPTENHSHPPVLSAAPAPGKLGAVSVSFVVLERGAPGTCRQLPAELPGRTSGFPFRLFQDARGRLVGAHFVGYMMSQIFLEPGVSGPELETLLRENDEAISRAAE